ncbi:MAG: L,D-transpeptidase [Desulfobacterales bacterium]|nr:L,D-transpeptidase [Desulfobacterales bacterium]
MLSIIHNKISIMWAILLFFLISSYAAAMESGGKYLDLIPDVFVGMSANHVVEHAFVVEKDTQKLFLFEFDGSYRKIFSMDCSTGESSGPKKLSGDKRTPEGVYFFIKEHKERDLSESYGSGAFPTDYPNILDKIKGKNGNAIWLHGLGKPMKPRDTQGCVALKNQDLDKVKKYVDLNRTPIIIEEKLSYVPLNSMAETGEKISAFISAWNDTFVNGTYHQYLEYFDSDYFPEISWWTEWKNLKENINDLNIDIKIKRASIYKHKDVYVVLFDHVIKSGEKEINAGTRKLFLSYDDEHLKIITEEFQIKPDKKDNNNPLLAKVKRVKKLVLKERDVKKFVNNWIVSWSSKNIKNYANCYSNNFRSRYGMNLNQWLSYKNRLNRLYDYINVSIENLTISPGSKEYIVRFVQNYESSGFSSISDKKLVLKQEKDKWKIYSEVSINR